MSSLRDFVARALPPNWCELLNVVCDTVRLSPPVVRLISYTALPLSSAIQSESSEGTYARSSLSRTVVDDPVNGEVRINRFSVSVGCVVLVSAPAGAPNPINPTANSAASATTAVRAPKNLRCRPMCPSSARTDPLGRLGDGRGPVEHLRTGRVGWPRHGRGAQDT